MAYEIEEILSLVDEKVEIYKPHRPDLKKGNKETPCYYPLYKPMVELYKSIRPHADTGVFPYELFAERSPNQTEEEFEYVKNNYKQLTLPVFMDFLNVVMRSFNDGNWSIEYTNDTEINGTSFRDYVENEIPVYGSVESFVKNALPALKLKDANGIIAVKPLEVQRDEEGNLLTGEVVNPVPLYYESKQVVAFKDDDYYLVMLNEKSSVKYGNRYEDKGLVFEFYDDENIWRIYQVGEYLDWNFEIELIYGHNIGEVPVHRLMGIQTVVDNEVLYQSPFQFAVDNLDLVLLNSSNLQISINNCVYPYRVMVGNICDFEDPDGNRCDGGSIYNAIDQTKITCPSCHGSGLRSRVSPMGVMLLKPPTDDDAQSEANITTPLQYISPDTGVLEFLRAQIEVHLVKAKNILHIHDSTTEVSGSENLTATGKAIDQKQMFSFVKPISDQLFELYAFILDSIGTMRYGMAYQSPSLNAPITFDFYTQEDYLMQISEAIKAGLPPFVIHSIVYKYLNTLFYNDSETSVAFETLVNADRLLTLSEDDIAKKQMSGTIAKWEELLHTSGTVLIKELMLEDVSFMDKDLAVRKELLVERAKQKYQEVLETLPQPLDTNQLVDEIVGNPNAGGPAPNVEGDEIVTPTNVEAEAKAKLKGTVGGVQGIIAINQAVAEGKMSEASAELLLQEIYGFTPDVSSRLIEPTGNNILTD